MVKMSTSSRTLGQSVPPTKPRFSEAANVTTEHVIQVYNLSVKVGVNWRYSDWSNTARFDRIEAGTERSEERTWALLERRHSHEEHWATMERHRATMESDRTTMEIHRATMERASALLERRPSHEEHRASMARYRVMMEEHGDTMERYTAIMEDHRATMEEHGDTMERYRASMEDHWASIDSHWDFMDRHWDFMRRHWAFIRRHGSILEQQMGPRMPVDTFYNLASSLTKQNLESTIKYVNECTSKTAIVKQIFKKSTPNPKLALKTLAIKLEKEVYPETEFLIVSLLSEVRMFANSLPKPTRRKLESQEPFVLEGIAKHSKQYSSRDIHESTLAHEFITKSRPTLTSMIPILGMNYKRSTSRGSYFMNSYCDFINQYGEGKKLKYIKPEGLNPGLLQASSKNRGVLKKRNTMVVEEVKASFEIPQNLINMSKLPPNLKNILIHLFESMMNLEVPFGILTDGSVYIRIEISVEEFFTNMEAFKKTQIVPYKFQIIHVDDPKFCKGLLNWLLEVEERRGAMSIMCFNYRQSARHASAKRRRLDNKNMFSINMK